MKPGADPLIDWVLPLAGILPIAWLSWRRREASPPFAGGWRIAAVAVYALTRLVLPWWLFVARSYDLEGPTDVAWWYDLHVEHVFAGHRPGVDFGSAYGPALPYLQALGAILLPPFPRLGVLVPFLLADGLTLLLLPRLGEALGSAAAGRWAAWWLLLVPVEWHQLSVRGQDEPIFGAFLAGALLASLAARPGLAALLLGAGFCCSKITFGAYALVLLLLEGDGRARLRFLAGAALPVLAAYGATLALGGRPFSWGSLGLQGNLDGVSLLDGASRVVPAFAGLPKLALAAAGIVAGILAVALRTREFPDRARPVLALAGAHAVFMLLMPSCLPTYAVQGLVPLLLLASLPALAGASRGVVAGIAVISVSVPLWWTGWRWAGGWIHILILGAFHAWILAGVLAPPRRSPAQGGPA